MVSRVSVSVNIHSEVSTQAAAVTNELPRQNVQTFSISGRSHYQPQDNRFHDHYSSLKEHEYRPYSVATTEIVDTDWEEDEVENDNANSPRVSLNSVRRIRTVCYSLYPS